MQLSLDNIYISARLQKKLDRIPMYPLTTVVAPAGYGKTTAVRWFREGLSKECMVLRLNVLGGGLNEFWRDFAELIGREAGASFSETLLKMGPPLDTTTQREFLRKIHELAPARETYLFVDDYHLVDGEMMTGFVLFISRNLPKHIHVVLISRIAVLSIRDRLLLSGRVNEIEEGDLRFDAQDIGNYFAQCGYPISSEDISHLIYISEGWAAALYLNLVSYADTGKFSDFGDIHTMMGTILFEPLPPDEKELLTVMSMMLVFSASQAEWISGRADAEILLRRLARSNGFITYISQDGTYKLHHLMQESVQQAFARLPEEQQAKYLSRAGMWQLEHGYAASAARLFYKARDFHGLMRAVECGQGADLSAEHKNEMLAWFRECPRAVCNAYPVAMLVYARRLFTFNMRAECTATLDGLLQSLNTNTTLSEAEKNNLLGEVEIVKSFLDFNNIKAMSAHHRRACVLMDRPTTAVSPTAVWGYGSPSVLISYYRLPGTLDREVAVMKESMPFWYRLNPNQGSGAEHVMEGEAFLMRGSFVDAEICQYRALHDAERDGQLCMVLAAHFLRLRAEVLQGEFSGVEPTLRTLRDKVLAQQEYVLLHSIDMCEAWLYALLGQPHSAADWLDEGRLEDTRLLFPSVPFLNTVYGQLLLAQGQFTRLIAREENERRLYRVYPMLLCEIYLDIQLAGALERVGKHRAAIIHLSQALNVAMPDRLYLPFVENQEYIAALLCELKSGPWEKEIGTILEQCAQWRAANLQIQHTAFGQAPSFGLTEKERSIARLAAEGHTNKEIAAQMFLSESRVKACLGSAFQKMGITEKRNKRSALKHLLG